MTRSPVVRFLPWALTPVFAAASLPASPWLALGFAGLFYLGLRDVSQVKHAVRRNYPLTGRLRYLLEYIRPEIRQYFIESDDDKLPFSRNQRAMVYARSKVQNDKRGFGTIKDVYADDSQWLSHSMMPVKVDPTSLRLVVGGAHCAQPYSLSVFNISAMSFGSLSANAIMALNRGAAMGGFAHDTGEGGIAIHHRKYGGDLIMEIGSGYFGCRGADGHFDLDRFRDAAHDPQVKMVEIKLSQGAKPGHGGVLPAPKISEEIAEARGVPMGVDCVSPASHSAFSSPLELMAFIQTLREASGGKPVGFKFCVGQAHEWFGLVKAMLENRLLPDFIVVDGSEGGTGSAPIEFADHMGMPLRDGLQLVHNTLVGAGLRSQIRIGASGKITSAFDIIRARALGADWCNSARGFMFALGCIQSRTCHTDHCPTGVATQDPLRQRALVVTDKAQRVFNFHQNTLHTLGEMMEAAGLHTLDEIRPELLMMREGGQAITLASKLRRIPEGSLLGGADQISQLPEPYASQWQNARVDQFRAES